MNMALSDCVTGKQETVKEKDIITAGTGAEIGMAGQKREVLTNKIISILQPLSQEERELVMIEVAKCLDA